MYFQRKQRKHEYKIVTDKLQKQIKIKQKWCQSDDRHEQSETS